MTADFGKHSYSPDVMDSRIHLFVYFIIGPLDENCKPGLACCWICFGISAPFRDIHYSTGRLQEHGTDPGLTSEAQRAERESGCESVDDYFDAHSTSACAAASNKSSHQLSILKSLTFR